MKKIIGVRLGSYYKGQKPSEFILLKKMDAPVSVKKRIVAFINKNIREYEILEFMIDEDGKKYVAAAKNLKGEVLNIIDEYTIVEFGDDNSINVSDVDSTNESMVQSNSMAQLRMVRRLSKSDDIGDRTANIGANLPNSTYIHNPIDTGVETYQDFQRHNKKFQPNWNVKHLRPFSDEK